MYLTSQMRIVSFTHTDMLIKYVCVGEIHILDF